MSAEGEYRLLNFLTGNILTDEDQRRIQKDISDADPQPILEPTDVAYYRPEQVEKAIKWGLISLDETGDALLDELQFLKSIGLAIQRGGRWYVDLDQKQNLYGYGGAFYQQIGTKIPPVGLAKLFIEKILPAYEDMVGDAAHVMPASIYDGVVARDQLREIQKMIRDLKSLT